MKTPTDKDFAYAMTPLKMVSWPLGTWPLQEYNVAAFLRFVITTIILLFTYTVVSVEMYLDSSNAEKNMDVLLLGVCSILAIGKVVTYRVYSEDLICNFHSAIEDYNTTEDAEKRKIMRHHAYMGRMALAAVVFLSYTGSMLITVSKLFLEEDVVVESVNATVKKTMDFPMPSDYTIEMLNIPENWYLVIFVLEYCILLVISTGNLGSDGLLFGIVFHLCGQAVVLRQDIIQCGDDKEDAQKRFTEFTKRHYHLLDLCEKLKKTMSFIMIIQIFTSCILICTSGFQFLAAMAQLNMLIIVKTLIVMSVLLMQMFAFSYIGDYLTEQMESIGYSAYSSRWYDLPKNLSRNFALTIVRCQRPIYLKAGKFFIINMESYMSILKTSMSYLSVLRLMVIPEACAIALCKVCPESRPMRYV